MANCKGCHHRYECLVKPLLSDGLYPLYDAAFVGEYSVAEGENIFVEGSPCGSIYIVKSGSAKRSLRIPGSVDTVLGFSSSWRLLGFEGVATGSHVYSVRALEKARVCEIDYLKLSTLMFRSEETHHWFMDIIARQYMADNRLSAAVRCGSVRQRIAAFLLSLMPESRGSDMKYNEIRLSMPRCDISNYLGVSAESLSRGFGDLSKRQVVKVLNRQVSILSVEELRSIAAGEVGPFVPSSNMKSQRTSPA